MQKYRISSMIYMLKKRLKHWIVILFICAAAIPLSMIAVNADMSPKPTLTIIYDSFPSNSYAAVLSTEDELGYQMWRVDDKWFEQENRWIASGASDEINRKFYEYVKDNYEKDGWYLWGNIVSCESKLIFEAARPSHFCVLVYLAEEDRFVTSDQEFICTNADFHVNLHFESGELIASKIFSTVSISRILLRMCLTIAIELAVSMAFLKNKNKINILTIAAVNCATQLILYIPLLSAHTAEQYYPMLIGLEIAIALAEGFTYTVKIGNEDMKHPYYYSVFANTLSFMAGILLAI